MFTPCYSYSFFRKVGGYDILCKYCIGHLRQAVLERPLSKIPQTMVLATWCKVVLVISRVGVKDVVYVSFVGHS